MKGTYDEIASEYYSDLHLTSRNFDAATNNFFLKKKIKIYDDKCLLEVGSGKGKLHRLFNLTNSKKIYVDLSKKMLSLSPNLYNVNKIQSDAYFLPFRQSLFNFVVSFLYDPFNQINFYEEIFRVLKKQGIFLGTLPHIFWGKKLRNIINIDHNSTVFKKISSKNKQNVIVNSYLMSAEKIKELLQNVGFTKIRTKNLYLPNTKINISEHILKVSEIHSISPYSIPIVLLIYGEKPK